MEQFIKSVFIWLPVLLIMAAVWFFARRQSASYKEHIDRVNKINDDIFAINKEILAHSREMTNELRAIRQVLEKGKK